MSDIIYISTPLWQSLSMRITIVTLVGLLAALGLYVMVLQFDPPPDINAPIVEAPQPAKPTPAPNTEKQTQQHINAPLIVVPYVEHLTSIESIMDEQGETQVVTKDIYNDRHAVFLPDKLDVHIEIDDDKQLWFQLNGRFDFQPLLVEPDDRQLNIRWDKARMLIGITDTTSLHKAAVFWDDDTMELEASTQSLSQYIKSGFAAQLSEPENGKETKRYHAFEVKFTLNHSDQLAITPLGKQSKIQLKNESKLNLKSTGNIPPLNAIRSDTQQVRWEVPHLIRNFPQYWVIEQQKNTYKLDEMTVGIALKSSPRAKPKRRPPPRPITSDTPSQQLPLLWTVLAAFLTCILCVELMSQRFLHWFQYLLFAASFLVFVLLHLSAQQYLSQLAPFPQNAILLLMFCTLPAWGLFGGRYGMILIGLIISCLLAFWLCLLKPHFSLLIWSGWLLPALWVLFWGSYRVNPPEQL